MINSTKQVNERIYKMSKKTLKTKFEQFKKLLFNHHMIALCGYLAFTKYKNWEFQIDLRDNWKEISLCSYFTRRLYNDFAYTSFFYLGPIFSYFVIADSRVWDDHTDKPITWTEMEELEKVKRIGKPKYKPRKRGKEKWYYDSAFLKIYNFDYLNDPYGITIDFSWLPLLFYSLIQVGISPIHKFGFHINASFLEKGPVIEFAICIFTFYIKLEFGKNTVIRKANRKSMKDFNLLVKLFANPYIVNQDDRRNIIQYQIERKDINFIQNILNKTDINKYNTDEIIECAMEKEWYNSDIFDLLLSSIHTFNNWSDIEKDSDCYNSDAISKLKKRIKK